MSILITGRHRPLARVVVKAGDWLIDMRGVRFSPPFQPIGHCLCRPEISCAKREIERFHSLMWKRPYDRKKKKRKRGSITGRYRNCGVSTGSIWLQIIATHTKADEPAFLRIFYPVIIMDKAFTYIGSHDTFIKKMPLKELEDMYSNEKHVTDKTPESLLFFLTMRTSKITTQWTLLSGTKEE